MGLLSILKLPRPQTWPAAAGVPAVGRVAATAGVDADEDDDEPAGPAKVKVSRAGVPPPPGSAGAGVQPHRVIDITDTQGAETTKNGVRPIAVKSEPADLEARLEARGKALRDAYAKLTKAQARLDEEIPKRNGDTKATMQAQKADVDKALSSIDRQLAQLDKDRKAVGNPATDAKTMNDIVARAKSPEPIGKAVEVDRHDDPLEKSPLKKQTTTTATEVKNGKSTTHVNDRSTSVGLDGVTRKTSDSAETVTAGGKTGNSSSQTTKVGPNGVGRETTKKTENEMGGRKTSNEETKTLQVGPGGVSSTKETKKTEADGSGSSKKTGIAGERGDGKVGGSATTSTTSTNAAGGTTTKGGSGKGGLQSGKDGIGAYGEGSGSVEKKGANGVSVGAVAGLNANVSCNIKQIPGEVPPKYVATTRINLGLSIKGSAGYGKEGGAGKAGASVSGSATVYMSASHQLSESQAAAYVAALKAGGVGGGSQAELAIIRTGISKSWEDAQRMYLGMQGKLGSAEDLDSMQAGDSKTLGRKTTGSAGLNGDAKGVGIELSAERSNEREMTVTKNQDGSATYDTKQGQGDKRSVGGTASVGIVQGGASIGKTVTTATGYKFLVKPEMKNARQLQDQIARLANASQAEVDAFAKAHPETVVERRDVRDEAKQNKVTAGIGPVKGTFMAGSGIEDTVTRDAKGNVVDTSKRGHNEGGLSITAAGKTIGSTTEEQSAPRVGADGERVVDVSRADSQTDAVKFLDSLPGVGTKKKDKGAVATATGAEEEDDTSRHNVRLMTLSVGDLKMLAAKAKNENAWMNSCPSPSHRPAWLKAASEINAAGNTPKAVENALARFVGTDNLREQIVRDTVRGKPGDVRAGAASEFPDSIVKWRKDYEDLVLAASEKQVAKTGESDKGKGFALAKDFLARLSSMSNNVRGAGDFKETDVKGEMLAAIASRQSKIEIEIRKLSGVDQATAEKGQERGDWERLLDACIVHQQDEKALFDKIDAENKETFSGAEAARNILPLTIQIKNLHAIWQKEYERMAMLAQENGWGKDRYYRFKPDTARLDHAVKTFSAGVASKAEPEKKDFKRNPNAISDKRRDEIFKDLGESDAAQYKTIKAKVERAYTDAKRLVDELRGVLAKTPYPTVMQFFKQGEVPFKEAEANILRCRENYHQDMFDFGLTAQEQLKEALPLLKKAKSFVPKKG